MPSRRGYCVSIQEAFQDRQFQGMDLVIRQAGPSINGIGYLSKALALFGDEDQERPNICWVTHPLGVVVDCIDWELSVSIGQMDDYLHFYTGGI